MSDDGKSEATPGTPAEQVPDPAPEKSLAEKVRESLGLGTDKDRYLDDEMQRPPQDRSPLT